MDKLETVNFLHLPDCVLVVLFGYLDATSLYQLSRSHPRFKEVLDDFRLWRHIDARTEPNTSDKVNYVIDKIHDKTHTVKLKAKSKSVGVIPTYFFEKTMDFDNLKVLALENQYIDGSEFSMNLFPKKLEELSLKRSYVKDSQSFFRGSSERLQHLRVLILDYCRWLNSSFVMSTGKYKNLEILSTVRCKNLEGDAISYMGIAKNGYKNLKTFDFRFTVLGPIVLKCFATHKSIISYYFQHERTFLPDYCESPATAQKGGKGTYHCVGDISDRDLLEYFRCVGTDVVTVLPQSVLYVDPYGECNCNFKDKVGSTKDTTNFELNTEDELYCGCCFEPRMRVDDDSDEEGLLKDDWLCSKRKELKKMIQGKSVCRIALELFDPSNGNRLERPVTRRIEDPLEEPPPRPCKRRRFEYDPSVEDDAEAAGPSRLSRERTLSLSNVVLIRGLIEGNIPDPNVRVQPFMQVEVKKTAVRRLSLRGFKDVSDGVLQAVQRLNLDLLDVTYTGCTAEGINSFLAYNPNCRVVHPDFCTCKPIMPL